MGQLYYLSSTSDRPLTQVVDTTRIPTITFDPNAAWVDETARPVWNPHMPLGPESVEISEAFGTPERLRQFLMTTLQPLAD